MTYTERFNKLVNTWERAYNEILPTRQGKMTRLIELGDWDNSNDNKIEHDAKVTALQNLLTTKK